MFKNMKLGWKLVIFFLLVGLIPFAVITVISVTQSGNALSRQAYGQLKGMREVKKAQIKKFFKERQGDMEVLMETVHSLKSEAEGMLESVQNNKKIAIEILIDHWFRDIHSQQIGPLLTGGLETFQQTLDLGEPSGDYRFYAEEIDEFVRLNGYYDYFVINPQGHIIHTQAKEADYNTNILSGKYKGSGLSRAVKTAMDTGKIAIEDFSPYAPSNGESAAFIAAPLYLKISSRGWWPCRSPWKKPRRSWPSGAEWGRPANPTSSENMRGSSLLEAAW